MNLVKIESHVDVSRPEQVEALNQFLKALNPDRAQADNSKEHEFAVKLSEKKEQTKKAAAKTVKDPDGVNMQSFKEIDVLDGKTIFIPGEETAEEETQQSTKTEDPTITIEQIRELVTDKAAKHREAIKAELSRLDAPNVTKLDKKHFPVFHEFLTGLK